MNRRSEAVETTTRVTSAEVGTIKLNKDHGLRRLFFLIFTASGFAGLIYESIWSYYLKLFLGHAAYAQTLVLATFMGGMAIGSWLCSRYSTRWKNLLKGYALAEGLIGLLAILFHAGFVRVIDLAYFSFIPLLGSPGLVYAFKWGLSTLLILPQSILLGMTFPLMTGGLIRWFPHQPGAVLAMLYFTNSLGAAVGVLASGFWLINWVGLPGTIRFAGIINIILAVTVWLLSREKSHEFPKELKSVSPSDSPGTRWFPILLTASFITGAASFMYEIGWIRMLTLVLGSSTHAFELMLSAFILGLALGGLWIRRKIDMLDQPVLRLGLVQFLMGLLALSTLLLYGNSFSLMQWIIKALPKTQEGYQIFNLSSHLIAVSFMLPTTFCAGMTLPLITYALFRHGVGEKSIGAVYAWNTLGAIIGVFFAIHLGMPLLGLKGLITFGASLDLALGLFLLWSIVTSQNRRIVHISTATAAAAVLLTLLFVRLDAHKMASGVYRDGYLMSPEKEEILFHRDGKTASVDLVKHHVGKFSIRTNGKSDAAIDMSNTGDVGKDEGTNILLASVPMALHPSGRTVANIGMGSGLTTHTLMLNPHLERVDTIEIESAMVEAARGFRPRVELAYADPRSRIFIDDAKTFFSAHSRKYDIIISEPSNPWVSGVSGLFSGEFYRLVRNYMNEDGLLVQWMQLYEIDISLVASVIKALSANFPDYVIYASDDSNILIVAKKNGKIGGPDPRIISMPGLAEELKKADVMNLQDFEMRRIGDKKALDPLFASFPAPPNSDYFPFLDLNAAKTRFMGMDATNLVDLSHEFLPAVEMLGNPPMQWINTRVNPARYFSKPNHAVIATVLQEYFMKGEETDLFTTLPDHIQQRMRETRFLLQDCSAGQWTHLHENLYYLAVTTNPYLTPAELNALWGRIEDSECYRTLGDPQKNWIALFKTVGLRNPSQMAYTAEMILSQPSSQIPVAMPYVLSAGVLGYLTQDKWSDALRLWTQYGPRIMGGDPPGLLVRMLMAHTANISQSIEGSKT